MDRVAWRAVVHGAAKSRTRLSDWTELRHILVTVMNSKPQKVKRVSCSVVSNSLRPQGLCSPWTSPSQNTGVGSLSLLQGIFPTQGSNPGLPHCRQILYQLSHKVIIKANLSPTHLSFLHINTGLLISRNNSWQQQRISNSVEMYLKFLKKTF